MHMKNIIVIACSSLAISGAAVFAEGNGTANTPPGQQAADVNPGTNPGNPAMNNGKEKHKADWMAKHKGHKHDKHQASDSNTAGENK